MTWKQPSFRRVSIPRQDCSCEAGQNRGGTRSADLVADGLDHVGIPVIGFPVVGAGVGTYAVISSARCGVAAGDTRVGARKRDMGRNLP
jgi:hypothetical protein